MSTPPPGVDARVVIPAAQFDAVIFDMDGVVTDTVGLHHAAWKRLFDEYLAERDGRREPVQEFSDADYRAYVDGRAREAGVAAFLASRGIELPTGQPDDAAGSATLWGLANRKNETFLSMLAEHGVRVFESTVGLVRRARSLSLRTGLVSASQNAQSVLAAGGISDLFDACVDGKTAAHLALPGKPDPAPFLEAAQRLGVNPARVVVVEDALAGVEAGRQGGFGLVIGVDRAGDPQSLRARGAHAVVTEVSAVTIEPEGLPIATACALCHDVRAQPAEWIYEARDTAPGGEGTREALFTLGNGYTATRGAASEAHADAVHYPGTYVAGVLNRLVSHVGGNPREDEAIVNVANWLPFSFRSESGPWHAPGTHEVLHDHWLLDLAGGTLARALEVMDPDGRRTRLHERRLVHMADPHLAAQQVTVVPENWSGHLHLRVGIDADSKNTNVNEYAELAARHLEIVDTGTRGEDELWVETKTNQSRIRVAQAARTRISDGTRATHNLTRNDVRATHDAVRTVSEGEEVVVEKVTSIYTSRDFAISEPVLAARDAVRHAPDFELLTSHHQLAWARLWQRFHLSLTGPDRTRLVLNLHLFHVLQTLSPHTADLDVGVPARGLHGEGYRGHYFWDEVFVFGLLNLRFPQLTRELILYRHRRLPRARQLAQQAGRAGAMYPWQSGSDGREETPRELFNVVSGRWMPDNSRRQYHVNLAVAYNIWQYWQVSGDYHFLTEYGAEMLLEISRFWASLAIHDPAADRYELPGVMGPDEFHDGYPDRPGEGVDNNAYTNVMVAWLMQRVLQLTELIGPRSRANLWERLAIDDVELERWEHMSRRILVPHHDGVISQFSGYEDLLELDWDAYRARYPNIGRLDLILEAEGDTPNRYKASKQADALMLFYLLSADELRHVLGRLGYNLEPEQIPRTIDYYLRRTSHGSTLSRVVHSWVLARSDRERSWSLFNEALEADIADTQGGTTGEGIHLGAMAGTVDIVQRCYTGLDVRDDVLFLNPLLPDELPSLELEIHYRGHWLTIGIDHDHVRIESSPGPAAPVHLGLRDEIFEVAPGDQRDLLWSHPSLHPK